MRHLFVNHLRGRVAMKRENPISTERANSPMAMRETEREKERGREREGEILLLFLHEAPLRVSDTCAGGGMSKA